jgi:hypothetical protein
MKLFLAETERSPEHRGCPMLRISAVRDPLNMMSEEAV